MSIWSRLESWMEAGLGFLYPDACQICGENRATAAEGYVCGRCWTGRDGVSFIRAPFCKRCGLPFEGEITAEFECSNCREIELHFVYARSAVTATGIVRDVIHRYKYNHALWFEPFLADLLIREARPALNRAEWDWLVPVPLHPLKEKDREFNQARRLAKCFSRATGIPVNDRLVRRAHFTRTQTRLSRAERAANVRRAFVSRTAHRLRGDRIVLLDDVLTTGATTSACAKVLLDQGAGSVCVWTIARGVWK